MTGKSAPPNARRPSATPAYINDRSVGDHAPPMLAYRHGRGIRGGADSPVRARRGQPACSPGLAALRAGRCAWSCSFGRAYDRPGPEKDADDRVVARCREARRPGGWQVVGQQPPGLLGGHGQAGYCTRARLVPEFPSRSSGDQTPGLGDRASDGDRHSVAGLRPGLGQAAGVGPPQPVEHRPGQVGAGRWAGRAPAGSAAGGSSTPTARAPGPTRLAPAPAHDTDAVRARASSRRKIPAICGPAHRSRSATMRGLSRRAARTHSACSSSSQATNSASVAPPGPGVP